MQFLIIVGQSQRQQLRLLSVLSGLGEGRTLDFRTSDRSLCVRITCALRETTSSPGKVSSPWLSFWRDTDYNNRSMRG
jgi:hypothetical protein